MQFIGIDAAKATFDIALPLSPGKYRTKAKLPNTPKVLMSFWPGAPNMRRTRR